MLASHSDRFTINDLLLWRCELPDVHIAQLPMGSDHANPALVDDLLVCSIFSPGLAVAVRRDTGEVAWVCRLPGRAGPCPLWSEGILILETSHTLCRLDPLTGQILWSFRPWQGDERAETIYSIPTIASGRVYFGDRYGCLYCLDGETGQPVWRVRISTDDSCQINGEMLVLENQLLFKSGAFHAFDTDTGQSIWQCPLDSGSDASPVRRLGKHIILESERSFYEIDPGSGRIVHEYHLDRRIYSNRWTVAENKIVSLLYPDPGPDEPDAPELEPPARLLLISAGRVLPQREVDHFLINDLRYDTPTRTIHTVGGTVAGEDYIPHLTAYDPTLSQAKWSIIGRPGAPGDTASKDYLFEQPTVTEDVIYTLPSRGGSLLALKRPQ